MQLDGNLDEDSTRMELLEIVGRPIEQIYTLPVAEILKGPGSPRFNGARQGLAWPSSVYLAGQPATRAFYTYQTFFFGSHNYGDSPCGVGPSTFLLLNGRGPGRARWPASISACQRGRQTINSALTER